MKIELFQTLEDRCNPEKVEESGPFICKHQNSWLGTGYYFWDTHIELAHWWGQAVHRVKGYIICKANGEIINDDDCWDLHGNGQHRKEFYLLSEELGKILDKEEITVSRLINYLKLKKIFSYKSIRVLGNNSVRNSRFLTRFAFISSQNTQNAAFFDLYPPVQFCLLEKTALNLNNYKVIYPNHYIEEYV